MRRIVITQNLTLDGVLDLEGGWFDPFTAGRAGLVDELRLFPDGTAAGLDLLEARPFRGGAVLLRYGPATPPG